MHATKKMAIMMILYLIVNVQGTTLSTDPCLNSLSLHSISGRSPTSSNPIPCDAYISPGWYKYPRYDMVTYNPGLNRCGSIFPIYLQGTLPNDTAIHNITACMVDPGGGCAETFIVRVKKCDEDRAYYLKPTSTCPSTYCFYASRNYTDVAPIWTPNSLSVYPDVDFDITFNPNYYFTCSFTPANEPILYKIEWFVNSKKIKNTGYLPESDLLNSRQLKESELISNGFKLNIMISCGITAVKSLQGEPGNYTQSADYYAGIRVLNNTITIQAGSDAYIYLKPTVPIACPNYTMEPYCNYAIWMYDNYNSYECTGGNIGSNQRCGVDIVGAKRTETTWWNTRQWEREIPMLIKHRKPTVYDNEGVYTLRLKVSEIKFNEILKGMVLDDVKVMIDSKETQVLQGKMCYGVVDPHMRTYDGNNYEMHMEGSYLMYRHTTLNVTVQVKTTKCWPWDAYCFCGVVINAGKDVFMLYVCQDYRVKVDRFLRCDDGLLKASSKGGSEYKVFLPTGAIVEMNIIRNNFINVYIYPSVSDKEKTEGLCGYFDEKADHDFKLRSGSFRPTPIPYAYVDDFSNSWRLLDSENLFPSVDIVSKYNSLSSMPNSIQFCYCEYNTEEHGTEYNLTSIHPEAKCDYRDYAECNDTREREFSCDHHRSKSYVNKMPEYVIVQDTNMLKRKKKSAAVTYTQAEAYDRCSQGFQDSLLVQLCFAAGLIDNSTLNLCVTDLMITGNDLWINEHIESVRLQCVHVIDFNNTLQRDMKNITVAIQSIACQRNCSGQGSCVNGTCICNDGYGETDCSVTKADPPEIFSTSHQLVNGTTHKYSCDRSTDNCQVIELYGQGLVYDPPPVLRIRKYQISTEYTKSLSNQYILSCTWRGRFQVDCNLDTVILPSDVFVTQYTYEISNDGVNFGSMMELHVFRATCQEVSHSAAGITYKLKDNYCYINDICHVHNSTDINNSCNICNRTEEKFKWSKSNQGDCSTKTTPEGSDSLTIGLSVVGVLVLVTAVVAGICICKYHKTKSGKCTFSSRTLGKRDDRIYDVLMSRTTSNLSEIYNDCKPTTAGTQTQTSVLSNEIASGSTPVTTDNQRSTSTFFTKTPSDSRPVIPTIQREGTASAIELSFQTELIPRSEEPKELGKASTAKDIMILENLE